LAWTEKTGTGFETSRPVGQLGQLVVMRKSAYVIENMVDVAGLEPAASSLRTRILPLEINGLQAKSFRLFSHMVTRRQARTPDSKANRHKNRHINRLD